MGDVLKICFKCKEATGNAGAGDGSNIHNDQPYCDECFVPALEADITALQGDNERLKKQTHCNHLFGLSKSSPCDECGYRYK